MRIAIVGTSNSLRKDGYTSYLKRNPCVSEIVNLSIGASTGLHSIRSTQGIDFRGFDYCLIDFSVNEEVVLKNNALNLDISRAIVESLIVRCLAGRCIPVITLLPRMIETQHSKMRRFYLTVAEEWGIPFFDGYELIDIIKRCSDIRGAGLFSDAAHIRPWVCLVFARSLVDGLVELPSTRIEERNVSAEEFASVKVSDCLVSTDGLELVARGSSRASGHFLKSTGSARILLRGIDGNSIIGICVNLSETNCITEFEGENYSSLDLRNNYSNNPSYRLVISALPLRETVQIPQGCIEIRTLDEAAAKTLPAVTSMAAELGRPTKPASGEIEIADIFVRRHGEVQSPYAPVEGLNRPLLLPSAESAAELAASVYRSLFSKEHDDAEELAARARAREKRRMKMRAAART